MQTEKIIEYISRGRTDFIFELIKVPGWKELLHEGQVKPLQWLVYYNDTTAMKAVSEAGANLSSINLDQELGHAAFFGHWKVCDFLIHHGANVNAKTIPGIETAAFMRDVRTKGETPLHRAAAYADAKTIEFLINHGADKEAKDANGDSPLTWASEHLRPGTILSLLAYPPFQIGESHKIKNTSDHGNGWGNSMDWKLLGDYLPE